MCNVYYLSYAIYKIKRHGSHLTFWRFTNRIIIIIIKHQYVADISASLDNDWRCFPDCLRGLLPGPFLLSYSVFVFIFPLFFRFCAVR